MPRDAVVGWVTANDLPGGGRLKAFLGDEEFEARKYLADPVGNPATPATVQWIIANVPKEAPEFFAPIFADDPKARAQIISAIPADKVRDLLPGLEAMASGGAGGTPLPSGRSPSFAAASAVLSHPELFEGKITKAGLGKVGKAICNLDKPELLPATLGGCDAGVAFAISAVEAYHAAAAQKMAKALKALPDHERKDKTVLFLTQFVEDRVRSVDTAFQVQIAAGVSTPRVPGWINAVLVRPALAAFTAAFAKLTRTATASSASESARLSGLAAAELDENRIIYDAAWKKIAKLNAMMDALFGHADSLKARIKKKFKARPGFALDSPDNVVQQLTICATTFKGFKKFVKGAVRQVPGASFTMPGNPTLKRVYRMLQKMPLRGNRCDSIVDVLRGMIAVDTAEQFIAVLEHLETGSGATVVDVKSRLRSADHSSGGWADCIVILQFQNDDGTVGYGEVQICFNLMLNARQGLAAHESFAIARAHLELLEMAKLAYTPDQDPTERLEAEVAALKTENAALKKKNSKLEAENAAFKAALGPPEEGGFGFG